MRGKAGNCGGCTASSVSPRKDTTLLVTQACPTLCDPWTAAHQAPLSMGFSGQEYWSRLSFPSPSDIPNPGIEPGSPGLSFPSPSDIPNPRIKPGSTGLSFPSPSDVPDPGIEPGSPGLSFPSPSNVPDPGIEPGSPPLQAGSLLLSHQASSFKNYSDHLCIPQNPVPGRSNHLCWQR